ncbi:MAG: fumarate hydratase [Oscillospiraceae bacterium]|jgi:fumarate hydratase subunit alpha|nr:fumarate hydratase [Oscillospiraceae bacterium]
MREIDVSQITKTVKELVIKANMRLPQDLVDCIACRAKEEQEPLPRSIFSDMLENLAVAGQLWVPICQDTGMAVIFVDVGQEAHLVGGLLEDAVNEGVRQGYEEGFLRKSIVQDPLRRGNTGDNTPAVIHTRLVAGDKINITAAPKGFGSENMSQIRMLLPSATEQDVIDFVVEVVKTAGGNPCPPVVLGVGIGGDFESCALLAKKALCRNVEERNSDVYYAALEHKMLERVNSLNIGPQGFGGRVTALAVNILQAPTHIAGLPVAVNVGCHVTRHAHAEI